MRAESRSVYGIAEGAISSTLGSLVRENLVLKTANTSSISWLEKFIPRTSLESKTSPENEEPAIIESLKDEALNVLAADIRELIRQAHPELDQFSGPEKEEAEQALDSRQFSWLSHLCSSLTLWVALERQPLADLLGQDALQLSVTDVQRNTRATQTILNIGERICKVLRQVSKRAQVYFLWNLLCEGHDVDPLPLVRVVRSAPSFKQPEECQREQNDIVSFLSSLFQKHVLSSPTFSSTDVLTTQKLVLGLQIMSSVLNWNLNVRLSFSSLSLPQLLCALALGSSGSSPDASKVRERVILHSLVLLKAVDLDQIHERVLVTVKGQKIVEERGSPEKEGHFSLLAELLRDPLLSSSVLSSVLSFSQEKQLQLLQDEVHKRHGEITRILISFGHLLGCFQNGEKKIEAAGRKTGFPEREETDSQTKTGKKVKERPQDTREERVLMLQQKGDEGSVPCDRSSSSAREVKSDSLRRSPGKAINKKEEGKRRVQEDKLKVTKQKNTERKSTPVKEAERRGRNDTRPVQGTGREKEGGRDGKAPRKKELHLDTGASPVSSSASAAANVSATRPPSPSRISAFLDSAKKAITSVLSPKKGKNASPSMAKEEKKDVEVVEGTNPQGQSNATASFEKASLPVRSGSKQRHPGPDVTAKGSTPPDKGIAKALAPSSSSSQTSEGGKKKNIEEESILSSCRTDGQDELKHWKGKKDRELGATTSEPSAPAAQKLAVEASSAGAKELKGPPISKNPLVNEKEVNSEPNTTASSAPRVLSQAPRPLNKKDGKSTPPNSSAVRLSSPAKSGQPLPTKREPGREEEADYQVDKDLSQRQAGDGSKSQRAASKQECSSGLNDRVSKVGSSISDKEKGNPLIGLKASEGGGKKLIKKNDAEEPAMGYQEDQRDHAGSETSTEDGEEEGDTEAAEESEGEDLEEGTNGRKEEEQGEEGEAEKEDGEEEEQEENLNVDVSEEADELEEVAVGNQGSSGTKTSGQSLSERTKKKNVAAHHAEALRGDQEKTGKTMDEKIKAKEGVKTIQEPQKIVDRKVERGEQQEVGGKMSGPKAKAQQNEKPSGDKAGLRLEKSIDKKPSRPKHEEEEEENDDAEGASLGGKEATDDEPDEGSGEDEDGVDSQNSDDNEEEQGEEEEDSEEEDDDEEEEAEQEDGNDDDDEQDQHKDNKEVPSTQMKEAVSALGPSSNTKEVSVKVVKAQAKTRGTGRDEDVDLVSLKETMGTKPDPTKRTVREMRDQVDSPVKGSKRAAADQEKREVFDGKKPNQNLSISQKGQLPLSPGQTPSVPQTNERQDHTRGKATTLLLKKDDEEDESGRGRGEEGEETSRNQDSQEEEEESTEEEEGEEDTEEGEEDMEEMEEGSEEEKIRGEDQHEGFNKAGKEQVDEEDRAEGSDELSLMANEGDESAPPQALQSEVMPTPTVPSADGPTSGVILRTSAREVIQTKEKSNEAEQKDVIKVSVQESRSFASSREGSMDREERTKPDGPSADIQSREQSENKIELDKKQTLEPDHIEEEKRGNVAQQTTTRRAESESTAAKAGKVEKEKLDKVDKTAKGDVTLEVLPTVSPHGPENEGKSDSKVHKIDGNSPTSMEPPQIANSEIGGINGAFSGDVQRSQDIAALQSSANTEVKQGEKTQAVSDNNAREKEMVVVEKEALKDRGGEEGKEPHDDQTREISQEGKEHSRRVRDDGSTSTFQDDFLSDEEEE